MSIESTPIHPIKFSNENFFYVKREDLIPFSFGGNKARKAALFFAEVDKNGYDCVVTYGSSSSNHCRVVANMAATRGLPCYIISPLQSSEKTYNSTMMQMFHADITVVPVDDVHDTIENKLAHLKASGKKPYFIAGGGHGNIGTQAYVDCYREIVAYENENNIRFDYIFHASGTGTTQAGLVCGQLLHNDFRKIVGISIARKNPRGRNVVMDSVQEYLKEKQYSYSYAQIDGAVLFEDAYVAQGYGAVMSKEIITDVMTKVGIPLDPTYTGKAFFGMLDYINKNNIRNKNILFIHTGGTPLFFDFLKGEYK